MADAVVAHKDVALALLGASAALAGLVLVFLGFLVSAYAALPGDASARVRGYYQNLGWVVLAPLGFGLACMTMETVWLLDQSGTFWVYVAGIVVFLAQLGGVAVATGWTLKRLLWG